MPPETLGANFGATHLPIMPETTPQDHVGPCLFVSGVRTNLLLSACHLLPCHMQHLSSGFSHFALAIHCHAPFYGGQISPRSHSTSRFGASLQTLPEDSWLKKMAASIGVSSHAVLCILLYSFSIHCPTVQQAIMCVGNHPCFACQYSSDDS